MRSGVGDIVALNVPPGKRSTQYYAGTGTENGQYGMPGVVAPGSEIPADWPLTVPGMAFLQSQAGGVFRRPVVLPDAWLPPALQRTNPLLRQVTYTRNRWDEVILKRAAMWNWIAAHGGLKSICRIPELGAPIWDQAPWEYMPSQGQEYRQLFSVAVGSIPRDGTNTVIGQFRVPIGYDGVLNQFVSGFTGQGFEEGSGSIVWRVKIGARWAKNLGNVRFTYGSLQTSLLVPGYSLRLISGQTVTIYASIPATSPVSGGVVTAAAFGWTYPHR